MPSLDWSGATEYVAVGRWPAALHGRGGSTGGKRLQLGRCRSEQEKSESRHCAGERDDGPDQGCPKAGGSHGQGHGAAFQVFKFRFGLSVIARMVAVAALPVREAYHHWHDPDHCRRERNRLNVC